MEHLAPARDVEPPLGDVLREAHEQIAIHIGLRRSKRKPTGRVTHELTVLFDLV